MTGIFTKQNVIDSILGGGGGGSTDGILNTLHVLNNAAFDGETLFYNVDGRDSSVTFKSPVTFEVRPYFENDGLFHVVIYEEDENGDYKLDEDGNPIKKHEFNISASALFKVFDNFRNHIAENILEIEDRFIRDERDIVDVQQRLDDCEGAIDEQKEKNENNEKEIKSTNEKLEELIKDVNNMINEMKDKLNEYGNGTPEVKTKAVKLKNRGGVNLESVEALRAASEGLPESTEPEFTDPVDDNKITELGTTFNNVLNSIKFNDSAIMLRLETNEQNINEMEQNLNDLKSNVNSNVSDFNDAIAGINNDIKTKYEEHKEDVKTINENINDVVDEITTATDRINTNEARISEVRNTFSDYYSKTETDNLLNPINENITLTANNIKLMTERITENEAKITSAENEMDDIWNKTNEIENDINTKYEEYRGNVEAINENISLVENGVNNNTSRCDSIEGNVSNLTEALTNYALKTESDDKYALKTNAEINETLTINATNGFQALTINSTPELPTDDYDVLYVKRKNMIEGRCIGITVGAKSGGTAAVHLAYKHWSAGLLGLSSYPEIITFSPDAINLNNPTTVNGDLTVNGTITSSDNFVKQATLNETLNNYALKNNAVINEGLTINSTANTPILQINSDPYKTDSNYKALCLMRKNMPEGSSVGFTIGAEFDGDGDYDVHLAYRLIEDGGHGELGSYNHPDIITFSPDEIYLNSPTTVNGDLTVNGTITSSDNFVKSATLNESLTPLTNRISALESLGGIYQCPDSFEDSTAGTVMNAYMSRIGKFGICFAEKDYSLYVLFYKGSIRDFMLKVSKLSENGAHLMFNQENNKTEYTHGIWHQINLGSGNTTITHYCPIEESMNSINDFIVGAPVYLTGKVYKKTSNEWQPSTESDTTDCICSVKTNGKWNEYVGICVKIDEENKCVTFASHGDYMVKVSDTSCYSVGDEVFIDEGELKTLTGQTAITSKIQRTTVGIVTAKINDTMLAVFKS